MMMQIEFTREPLRASHGSPQTKDFEGYARAIKNTDWQLIEIGFNTNPDGEKRSHFYMYLAGRDFQRFAQLMVEANPDAAIKAFGAAMQDVCIPPPVSEKTATVRLAKRPLFNFRKHVVVREASGAASSEVNE